jgi:hypothetical protein
MKVIYFAKKKGGERDKGVTGMQVKKRVNDEYKKEMAPCRVLQGSSASFHE